nr:hypothetical protein B0A51_08641 [Rachicladosporium sp. CCFEE 5018]
MAPTGDAVKDWVWSNTSNVHVANNREWFTIYTPFSTNIGSIMTLDTSKAEGVGTVELDMHLEPDTGTGETKTHKLILHDVLYAPHHICNIFASSEVPNLEIKARGKSVPAGRLEDDTTGQCIGHLDLVTLYKLWLVGQPAGQSSLDPTGHYVINAYWPGVDRRAWQLHNIATDDEPYTKKEKAWLKKHWEDEWHFVVSHGGKMYDEENRRKARTQVRTTMVHERVAAMYR